MTMAKKAKRKYSVQTQNRGVSVFYEKPPAYLVETPRKQRASTVAVSRKYAVAFVSDAKSIATGRPAERALDPSRSRHRDQRPDP